MKVSKSEFINGWIVQQPESIHEWYSTEDLGDICEKEYIEVTDRLGNPEFGKKFKLACDVASVAPIEYNYKLEEVAPNKKVILSIRFRNRDKSRPFVEIVWANFDLESYKQQLNECVKNAYSLFHPNAIRYHSASLTFTGYEDFGFYAGTFANLKLKPLASEIHLREAKNLEWYDCYLQEYEMLIRTSPLKEIVSAESVHSLEESMKNRLLYVVSYGNEWIGLIAAVPRRSGIYSGIYIIEELLIEEFRGRGFAEGIQSQFASLTRRLPETLLYGTIDPANLASLRTAESIGRKRSSSMIFRDITY